MARGGFETGEAFVEMAVNMNMTEFPALEVGLMVTRVVVGEEHVMITAGPPNFGVGDHGFFFLSQR